MKIISKFKDFYDYKVAKYGMDEKLVYTRKTYSEYFERFVIDVYTASDDRISEENFNKNLKENFEYFKGINFHKILILGEKLIHLFFTENGVYTHLMQRNLMFQKEHIKVTVQKKLLLMMEEILRLPQILDGITIFL